MRALSEGASSTLILDWVLVAVGLLLLVAGGEALVRGASGIALLARVTTAVMGLIEWPVMMLAAFQIHLLARDGAVERPLSVPPEIITRDD